MWLSRLRNLITGPRRPRHAAPKPRRTRLLLEQLEDRSLLSTFAAASVADLIGDINAANLTGGSNSIALAAGTTFTLTAVDNTTDGATGLPVIAANDSLTLVGNGATIARNSKAPAFRLLDVAAGATLTLQNLTLQGGLAFGSGVQAEGGAVHSQGAVTLNGVTVQYNTAQGFSSFGSAGSAAGGGIYSGGALTVEASTVQYNQGLGGDGSASSLVGGRGGSAEGGGVFLAGGTAVLDNATLYSNSAQGGNGASANGRPNAEFGGQGFGGWGLGGGLDAAGGTVSLHGTTVGHNAAKGGQGQGGGTDGEGVGGGLYLAASASVCLDAFTQANVKHNSASTSAPDISGSYTTCP